jgi:hypothetical protein
MMTGLLPERHGITEFFHTLDDLRAETIWDRFVYEGLPVGLFNLPMTWPIFDAPGFIVPSPWARDDAAWPPGLSSIRRFYRGFQKSKTGGAVFGSQGIAGQLPILMRSDRAVRRLGRISAIAARSVIERDRTRRAAILREAKLEYGAAVFSSLYIKFKPRLSVFVTFEADYITHRGFEPGMRSGGPAIRRIYRRIDRCIGEILSLYAPGTITAVVSEHGMSPENEPAEAGGRQLLIRGKSVRDFARISPGISAISLARWIAFRRDDGGPLEEDTRSRLDGIIVAETGLPLFRTWSHSDNEVILKLNIDRTDYGRFGDDLTGLTARSRDGRDIVLGKLLRRMGPIRAAMHDREGIFAISGPGIRESAVIDGAKIIDVMPTLLHACGLEVPSGLDGTVLDIFKA